MRTRSELRRESEPTPIIEVSGDRFSADRIVALMEHAQAAGRQVGTHLDTSWVRLHDCYANEDGGDTSRCATVAKTVVGEQPAAGEEWATGVAYEVDDTVTYNGAPYVCIQAHTSQAGWEPDAAPSLWSPA